MPPHLLASYAGPDQVMGVTSGLASLLGLLLIFWNKVVGAFYRVIGKSRHDPEPTVPPAKIDSPPDSQSKPS